jgi:hypothetical protein
MKIHRAGILFLAVLWGWESAHPQWVCISGTNPGYAGKELRISVPGNPFLDIPLLDTLVRFDSLGFFRADIRKSASGMVSLATGIYKASLYAEPGGNYQVELPPFRDLSYSEKLSPYYEPLKIPLRALGPGGKLNREIYRFDSLFNRINSQILYYRNRNAEPPLDSLTGILRTAFSEETNPWFCGYMRYKSGILALNAGLEGLGSLSLNYLGSPVREDHPAYMELFSAMFRDFLVYYGRTMEGRGIRYQINRTHDLDSLRSIVTGHEAVTSDTLCDLVLLQELPRMFYRGDYHKEAILILLDSMAAEPVKPVYGLYASQIREKLSSLVIGHFPPGFRLKGTDGKEYTPASFLGKYTYLMFCTPENYGCMTEYPFLKSYFVKHADYLNVVTVLVAGSEEEVDTFMKRNGYYWTALYSGDRLDLLDAYMVKAFPVAYLLGPDGKLILSPAAVPSEGFEQQLFQIMRSRGDI